LKNSKLISEKIDLKDGYIPRDIIKREDTIYVLTSKKVAQMYNIEVLSFNIKNLNRYDVLFSFKYPSFARSFEYLDKAFYFGIGSDVDEGDKWDMRDIKKQTGDILRYKL
jgi:hypothetical protein